MEVLVGRNGAFGGMQVFQQKRKGEPDTGPTSNVARYRGWVYSAASRNAQMMAQVPLRLYATRGSGEKYAGTRYGGKRIGRTITKQEREQLSKGIAGQSARFRAAEEVEEITSHPLIDTGLTTNFLEGMTLLGLYMELTGNAYLAWEIDQIGTPTNLTVLPSQNVKAIVSMGEIVAYELGSGADKIRIPANQVAHNRFPNPSSMIYGLAPLTAVAMGADRDVDMDIYEGALNSNMGVPPYAITFTDDNVTESDIKAYKREWNAQRSGVANAGKPLFGKGSIEIKELAISPKEMAFLQGRKYTMEQIFGVFGVPPALAKTEGVPRANLESALYQWTAFTITPRLRFMEACLNAYLIPAYNEPRLFLAYDSCVTADKEFDLKRTESMLRSYVTTINEVRNSDGMEPVEWGDVPRIQSTGAALGETAAEDSKIDSEKRLKKVARTATLWADPSAFKAQDRSPDDAPSISGGENPEPTEDERKIMRVTDQIQNDQRKDILVEYDAKAPQYDAMKYEPVKYSTLYLDDAMAAMIPSWERGLIVGNIALPEGARIDVGSFIEQPKAIEAVRKNTLRFLDSESESVGREFRKRISDGIKSGDSVQQIRKRIEGMFADDARNARSLTIARTESARAIELGRESSWAESGIISGKRWDANGDSCPFCQAMHGREVSLGSNYFDQGDTLGVEFNGNKINMSLSYDATPAPPLHPNCRCVLEPIFIEDGN